MATAFRPAWRALRRQPRLFAIAATVLALAIGASSAVFSVVDAVLLRPLPVEEPDRLVVGWERVPEAGVAFSELSYPNYLDWQAGSRSFAGLAAMATVDSAFVLAGDEPAQVPGRFVSGTFFDVLGARALLGRTVAPADDRAGAPRVALISHGLWQRRFGSDPALLGRTVVIADQPTTIVGVMPPEFRYPPRAELWMPIVPANPEAAVHRGLGWLVVVGRLAPGTTAAEARAGLDVIAAGIWAEIRRKYPVTIPDTQAVLVPFADHLFGPARRALLVLLGAILLVLLIACANVCALLLARAAAREREIAVRLAIGASRGRLARELLAESALLAAIGGAAGVLLAHLLLPALVALAPAGVPRLEDTTLDGRVLAFALTITLLSALATGLAPALMALRPSLTGALAASARTSGPPSHGRLRGLLVGTEAAVALVLLAGAGLLAQTFGNLVRVDLGFEPRGVLGVSLAGGSVRNVRPQDLYRTLLERIRALPGVEAAGASATRPLRDPVGNSWPFVIEGQSDADAVVNPPANLEDVTPGYLEAMQVPLLRGRTFDESDGLDAPGVIVVSLSLAERHWPGQDAIGKRLKLPLPGTPFDGSATSTAGDRAWLTVIGIVGEARYRGLQAARPDVYMSYLQTNHGPGHILVRATGDPGALVPSVRAAVRSVDRALVVSDVQTMEASVSEALGGARFGMQLLSGFALAAVALAALGIYGVVGFTVGRRTREIGVRMALGARRGDVVRLVLAQGMMPMLAGVVVGGVGALVLGRALRHSLYGISPQDPFTLATAALVLVGIAALACWLPARRAAGVDPASALRE